MNQDYMMSQASNYYPIYQLSQPSNQYGPQYSPQFFSESAPIGQANQIDYQEYPLRQGTNNYYPVSNQYSQQSEYQQGNGHQNIQPDESIQKPSYYYPKKGGQIGTSPYTFHANPSQANAFNSKPYGNQPGTLDVHQVLDQFIRSAGLSPHGDHENANKDRAYNEDQALSVKKLYSYPFYFSSSGDRPHTIRWVDFFFKKQINKFDQSIHLNHSLSRQSIDEANYIDEQPMPKVIAQRVNKPTSAAKIELPVMNGKQEQPIQTQTIADNDSTVAAVLLDDENSFIAKNAAALQEFLANKPSSKNNNNDAQTND